MKFYEEKEERINYISHLLALVVLSFILLPIIFSSLVKGEWKIFISYVGYYLSVGAMFASSFLYHRAMNPKKRRVLQLLDHCAIYFCIAGTYTPILILGVPGKFSGFMAASVWIIALIGIYLKVYSFRYNPKSLASRISIVLYLLMGWISIFLFRRMLREIGIGFILFLLLGGILYTIGVYFYKNEKIPYNHAIWHILIIGATFSMLYGILAYLPTK